MSITALAYESYKAPRGQEWLVRIGDPRTPPILFLPPLLEEANRTRALMIAIMRRLARQGHGCWLPDLSGTGESLHAIEATNWADWEADVAAAAAHVAEVSGKPVITASIRGGCLLDHAAGPRNHWRFAPVNGANLVRDLDRASLAGGAEWAGYAASLELRNGLTNAQPVDAEAVRIVRLVTDAQPADLKVEGPSLWRRSEPGTSDTLADALATDLDEWSRLCAAS